FGIGPRLSAAFQATPKTVIRGGWGINYQFAANASGATIGSAGIYPLAPLPNNAQYVNIATPGAIVSPTWPVTDPNVFPPAPGVLGAPNTPFGPTTSPYVPDPNENRPPRIMQFNIGFERQITPNFVVDVAYVGNRAVWLPGGPLGFLSQISPQKYASYHLYPYPGTGPCSTGGGVCASNGYDNYSDYLLLQQPINNPQVVSTMASRGITNLLPYSGFPTSSSLQSTLYPFPQFGAIVPTSSPTGNSKYDGLQIRVNKRLSHGLQLSSNFAWAQGFDRPAPQDFFNPEGSRWVLQQIPTFDFNLTAVYTVPKVNALPKFARAILGDWQIGWYSNYQSGQFLTPPASPNFNFLPSEDIRNPGVPLYVPGVNINDHSTFNAQLTQVLNPAAWSPCPVNATCAAASPGAFGPTSTLLYKDFKGPRTPTENANLGRHFRVRRGEHSYDLYIRSEFVNIFNRTLFPNPSTTNPQNPVARLGPNGPLLSGFGVIGAYFPAGSYSSTAPYLLGRTGTIIARFSF
ncbi:MAG: hypothetical protein JO323_18755, partial [Acidobacteriia bacterium]|nr:hypothetical protein [Terriglobia bacterium]